MIPSWKPEKHRPVIAVAPMMDWTDRHCRYFHRVLSRRTLLYTEMVVAEAVIHGDRQRLLGFDDAEQPVALQIGGCDPELMARAAGIAAEFGYCEINLNVGCPSNRVQSGKFGACLMREPGLVGECVASLRAASRLPVTVKCRLAVDHQDPEKALDELARAVWSQGCERLWVHARKAWLSGLSPSENRNIPPLDYERVRRLKRENPSRFIGLNGGLETLIQASEQLIQDDVALDGLMFGRAAYRRPDMLRDVDAVFYGEDFRPHDGEVIERMQEYCRRHLAGGGLLHHVTRHMIGLFHGRPGARRWRQILSTDATRAGADVDILQRAFEAVRLDANRYAA